MNKIFIIGNGFDLAHNLKTRYSDFILWYMNKAFNTSQGIAQKFEDALIETNSYIGYPLKELKNISDIKSTTAKFSSKNNFFKKLVSNLTEFNWVDIELEYYNEIKELYKKIESNTNLYEKDNIEKVEKLNICFEAIKTELITYLKTIDTSKVTTNNEIHKIFISELNQDTRGIKTGILFLNFNYTNTINNYIEKIKITPVLLEKSIDIQTIHIHGKLEQDPDLVIFGYGDELDPFYKKIEEMNKNSFLRHMKSFSYFKTPNYRNLSRFIDSSQFEVHIMGHSCGLSDRLLLNSIFESNNCKGIKIHYYQKSEVENDFFEKTQEISRHFRSEFKNEMRKKIIPFEESSPLVSFKG